MKFGLIVSVFICVCAATRVNAELKKLAISDVKAGPGLLDAAQRSGTTNSLQRVVEAFDSQLIDRMHGTRKFDIVTRSDLKQLVKEGDASGSGFKIPEADFVLVATLEDFQDYQESLTLATTGEKLSKRVIRIGAVMKIYDSKAGRLLESANIRREVKTGGSAFDSTRNGDLADALLGEAVGKVVAATADRVSDVIFPAKIVSKIDARVMINRGDGTDIAAGEVWQVWALGAEVKDPDTGEVIDRERLPVGKVKIIQVNPKTSMAEIVEDQGISLGSIAQRPR